MRRKIMATAIIAFIIITCVIYNMHVVKFPNKVINGLIAVDAPEVYALIGRTLSQCCNSIVLEMHSEAAVLKISDYRKYEEGYLGLDSGKIKTLIDILSINEIESMQQYRFSPADCWGGAYFYVHKKPDKVIKKFLGCANHDKAYLVMEAFHSLVEEKF